MHVSHMKTLTLREFFHSPTLVKSLHPGQTLVVTSDGKPNLIVTKADTGRAKNELNQINQILEQTFTSKEKCNELWVLITGANAESAK